MLAFEYQKRITKILKTIFGEKLVRKEWSAASGDNLWRDRVYAPRVDIAVGPFNSRWNHDLGIDSAAAMELHPMIKEINERTTIKWNEFSRCAIAIEIEFGRIQKYILGDIVNASILGGIGIVIANKESEEKIMRAVHYFESMDIRRVNICQNLIVFNDKNFLDFLSSLPNDTDNKPLLQQRSKEITNEKFNKIVKATIEDHRNQREFDKVAKILFKKVGWKPPKNNVARK